MKESLKYRRDVRSYILSSYTLASFLLKDGKVKEAAKHLEEALNLQVEHFPEDEVLHTQIKNLMFKAADKISFKEARAKEETSKRRETEVIQCDSVSECSGGQVVEMSEVSEVFHRGLEALQRGEWAKACREFECVYFTLRSELGENHPDLLPVLKHLVIVWKKLSNEGKTMYYQGEIAKLEASEKG